MIERINDISDVFSFDLIMIWSNSELYAVDIKRKKAYCYSRHYSYFYSRDFIEL